MNIIVIGGGIVGVATAFVLVRGGHRVTLIERNGGPGLETSFANGALITPSMCEPWNAPGAARHLLASIGHADAAMQLRLKALPSLFGWGLRFFAEATPAAYHRSSIANLRLALRSSKMLAAMCSGLPSDLAQTGSIRLFRDRPSLDQAVRAAEAKLKQGLRHRALMPTELTTLEPGLSPIAAELAGAIFYPDDAVADAYRFCVQLADQAKALGVTFRFNAAVSALEERGGRIIAAHTDGRRVEGDAFIVATGSFANCLLRTVDFDLPIRPVKGYSVSYRFPDRDLPIARPIVDDDLHAVVTPLGDQLRVAGTAEFAGFDRSARPERIANLNKLLGRVLPHASLAPEQARPWHGLRSVSVDGVPIIGRTAIANLFVNTGHGHLGWTMAAGAAELLADQIDDRTPAVDPEPYHPRRFRRDRKVASDKVSWR